MSTSLYEGLSGVTREALAMAKPVVCASVGGNPELVIPGETGLLFPPQQVWAVVASVLRVLEDPQSARRMALRGRELVLQRHTRQSRVEKIEALFREALVA